MRKQFGRSLLALCLVATAMAVPTHENERALQAVTQGATQFSNDFFKAVSAQQPGNIISSPLSAYMVLTMASSGAGGNTLEQFRNVLHLPTDDALTRSGSQSIIDSMNNVKDVNLRLANKIYAAAKFPVKQSFQDVVANFFRSASQSVDFTDSVTAANTINRWCEEQTNNRIKDLINPGDLDSMTAMVLVNAVYFKGNWKHKFNPDHTTDRPFHISESVQKNVPTMYIKDDFKYGDISEINAKFVEIPYKGDGMSMIIILPDNINGLAEVVEKLPQINLANLVQTAYKREVKLFLPKFKIETKIELNNILQKLGLTDMYSNRANFSGISDVPLAVSKAVQKAYIEVNEEGSEAAAATGLGVRPLSNFWSPPKPIEFRVNRPFQAFVRYGDLILFSAKVAW